MPLDIQITRILSIVVLTFESALPFQYRSGQGRTTISVQITEHVKHQNSFNVKHTYIQRIHRFYICQ